MEKKITLIKNNSKRDWSDLEWIEEFYMFLQGNIPVDIQLGKGRKIKLSKNKAFDIIWYLQEHFSILPDSIEKCDTCGWLYDSHSTGYHSELTGKFFCGACFPPFLDEREDKILAIIQKKLTNKKPIE